MVHGATAMDLAEETVIEWWRNNRDDLLQQIEARRHVFIPVHVNTAEGARQVSHRLTDWFWDGHEAAHPRLYSGWVQIGAQWHVSIGIY
jgi:hypothetical protein